MRRVASPNTCCRVGSHDVSRCPTRAGGVAQDMQVALAKTTCRVDQRHLLVFDHLSAGARIFTPRRERGKGAGRGRTEQGVHEGASSAASPDAVVSDTKKGTACDCRTLFVQLFLRSYFTSSKTTVLDYQCVSIKCREHVAKTEITIDNQHVTKPMQRYGFLPKYPKVTA